MREKRILEDLRRLDMACAQRARWLGIREKAAHAEDEETLERLRDMRTQLRDAFNRW